MRLILPTQVPQVIGTRSMVIRQIFSKCTRAQRSTEWNNRGNSMAIILLIPSTMHQHWRTSAKHHSWECRLISPRVSATKWGRTHVLGSEKIKFVPTKLNQKDLGSDNHYNLNCKGNWQGYGDVFVAQPRTLCDFKRFVGFTEHKQKDKFSAGIAYMSTVTRKRAGRWGDSIT